MSGDPYVCPHGFVALPICAECPAPTGYLRMFNTMADFAPTPSEAIAALRGDTDAP